MNLTAYDTGARSPAELFPKESRLKAQRRTVGERRVALSDSERRRRQEMVIKVQDRYASYSALGRAVRADGSSVSKWLRGELPVPDRCVVTLERIAGGGE